MNKMEVQVRDVSHLDVNQNRCREIMPIFCFEAAGRAYHSS